MIEIPYDEDDMRMSLLKFDGPKFTKEKLEELKEEFDSFFKKGEAYQNRLATEMAGKMMKEFGINRKQAWALIYLFQK